MNGAKIAKSENFDLRGIDLTPSIYIYRERERLYS